MVDESTRAGLEIALRAALRDQSRANATVEFLREKLGLADTGSMVLGPGDGERDEASSAQDVGPISVTEGEFYGMSQPKAAAAFLERAGRSRPQRTEAIMAALKKGGIEFGGKDPLQTFYAILARNPIFHNVGRSTWGLSAWYPNAIRRGSKRAAPSADEGQPQNPDDGDAADVVDGAEGDAEA